MIIIEKDRHMRRHFPFFQANVVLNNWYLENINSEANSFISLGDLYHTAIPSPDEIDEMERFFAASKFKQIYLLAGNHDYSDSLRQYSIMPMRNNSRVHVITEPCVKTIEGKTFAFLPFLKTKLRETYENLGEEFINADYVAYHFDDESIQFGKIKTGIDLSYLKGKRLGGHIHTMQKNYEIGMPIISSFTEKGQQTGYYEIHDEVETFVETPRLIDYYDIEYGEPAPVLDTPFPIFDIHRAPSRKQAEKLYKEICIHDIFILDKKKSEIKHKEEKKSSVIDFFSAYIKQRDDLKDWSLLRLKNLVEKK